MLRNAVEGAVFLAILAVASPAVAQGTTGEFAVSFTGHWTDLETTLGNIEYQPSGFMIEGTWFFSNVLGLTGELGYATGSNLLLGVDTTPFLEGVRFRFPNDSFFTPFDSRDYRPGPLAGWRFRQRGDRYPAQLRPAQPVAPPQRRIEAGPIPAGETPPEKVEESVGWTAITPTGIGYEWSVTVRNNNLMTRTVDVTATLHDVAGNVIETISRRAPVEPRATVVLGGAGELPRELAQRGDYWTIVVRWVEI